MEPTHHTASLERWIARSVRVLWWIGGLVLLVCMSADMGLASDTDRDVLVFACCVGLIAAYALSSRRPTIGLLAACAVGVVLAIGAHTSVPDALLTTWATLVLVAGVATFRAPVAHLPWLGVVVGATVLATGDLFLDADLVQGLAGFLPLMALSVGAGGWRRLLRRQRELALIDARETERTEIARELHDVVAHHVTAIVVQAQAGQVTTDPVAARATLAAIEAEGAAAMAAMRRMVASLRGAELPTVSSNVAAELDDLATTLRAAGIRVEETIGDVPSALAPTIVRLTREAFTNVRKHAIGATWVRLTVHVRDDAVHWSVIDDGRVAGSATGDGFGLVGLRERVDALGGHFTAGPHPDGWEVRAELPRGAPT